MKYLICANINDGEYYSHEIIDTNNPISLIDRYTVDIGCATLKYNEPIAKIISKDGILFTFDKRDNDADDRFCPNCLFIYHKRYIEKFRPDYTCIKCGTKFISIPYIESLQLEER